MPSNHVARFQMMPPTRPAKTMGEQRLATHISEVHHTLGHGGSNLYREESSDQVQGSRQSDCHLWA